MVRISHLQRIFISPGASPQFFFSDILHLPIFPNSIFSVRSLPLQMTQLVRSSCSNTANLGKQVGGRSAVCCRRYCQSVHPHLLRPLEFFPPNSSPLFAATASTIELQQPIAPSQMTGLRTGGESRHPSSLPQKLSAEGPPTRLREYSTFRPAS